MCDSNKGKVQTKHKQVLNSSQHSSQNLTEASEINNHSNSELSTNKTQHDVNHQLNQIERDICTAIEHL